MKSYNYGDFVSWQGFPPSPAVFSWFELFSLLEMSVSKISHKVLNRSTSFFVKVDDLTQGRQDLILRKIVKME